MYKHSEKMSADFITQYNFLFLSNDNKKHLNNF